MNLPSSGITSRRAAELLSCGVREAARRLRAMGYENRQGMWWPANAPHRSMDKWNSKATKGTGL